jgi:hypothetical protein
MKTQFVRVTILLFVASSLVFAVQTRRFTRNDIEYELELPSPAWQVISRVDVHTHLEFVNGNDPANGYLRLRKIVVGQPTTSSDLFRQDEKWELQQFAGYVVCSECKEAAFKGRLSGDVFCYEYVISGRTMHDRIYYLEVDKQTFYSLRFTVAREKLQDMRAQMDFIAGSFHLK